MNGAAYQDHNLAPSALRLAICPEPFFLLLSPQSSSLFLQPCALYLLHLVSLIAINVPLHDYSRGVIGCGPLKNIILLITVSYRNKTTVAGTNFQKTV